MRVLMQRPWLSSLGVLLAALMAAGSARADVTTDQPGSIIIFPKVVSNSERDTLIQITNTSPSLQAGYVHCVYTDTSEATPGNCAGTSPQSCSTDDECIQNTATPAGHNCDPAFPHLCCIRCGNSNFDVQLTPLQPTVWRVSVGRDQSDQTKGFFFGSVPPKPIFEGALRCFQTDSSGVPTGGNSLKGEAIIQDLVSGQISEYNAVAIQAINSTTVEPVCVGGGAAGDPCANNSDCSGGECKVQVLLDDLQYNACPQTLLVNHWAETAQTAAGATVRNELTLVPCSAELAGADPVVTTVGIDAYNEYEQMVSQPRVRFACWTTIPFLDEGPFNTGVNMTPAALNGATFVKTRVYPVNSTTSPVIGVLEEFYDVVGEPTGTAAVNLHTAGSQANGVINLPAGQ